MKIAGVSNYKQLLQRALAEMERVIDKIFPRGKFTIYLDPDLPKKETKKIIVSLSDTENVDSMAVPTATGWKITIDTQVEAPTKEDVYQTLVHEITHISQSMNGFLGYELSVSMDVVKDLYQQRKEDLHTSPRKTKQTIRRIMEHRHPTKATEHEARLVELIYLLQKNQFAQALNYLYQEAEYYQNFDFRTLAKKATSLGVTREQLEGFRQYAQEQIGIKFEEIYSYAQQNTATTELGRNLFRALEAIKALAPLLSISAEPYQSLVKQYYDGLTPEQRERDYLTNWKYIQRLVGETAEMRQAAPLATTLPSLDDLLASLPPELLENQRRSLLEDAEKYGAFKKPTEAEVLREAKKQVLQQNPDLVRRAKQRRDPNDRTRALVEIDNAVDNLYPDVEETLLAQRQETAIRTAFERLYEEAVENLQGEDGADCFRVMSLPAGQDPTTLQRLGIYWAHDEAGAGEYFADDEQQRKQRGDTNVMYRARIDAKSIDAVGTLAANLVDPQEAEVRFRPGTKIFVYDVFCLDGKCADAGINDWRQC